MALCVAGFAAPALADDFTFTNPGDKSLDWGRAANWSPAGVPGITDDATVKAGLLIGPRVLDDQAVHSLVLNSGINVYRGGSLTVTGTITHNGSGYFINNGTVLGNLTENGYLASAGTFMGDVTVTGDGVIISENASGSNSWTGNVVSNDGWIYNSYGRWTGDVVSNAGTIENRNGATWIGDVNNAGEIDTDSTWIGDVHNTGIFIAGGVLTGSIDNSNALVIAGQLRGVRNVTNTGNLALDDNAADDVLRARSLHDTGTEVFDIDTSKGASDRIILSGDYTGTPALSFRIVGGENRTINDIVVVAVGGTNSATVTADGLPADGMVSYRLTRRDGDWVIVTRVNEAPQHAAGALAVADATLVDAIALDAAPACGTGAWVRGLDHRTSAARRDVELSGTQFGYDFACVPVGSATIGLGLTMGLAGGSVAGGGTTGSFDAGFGGLYAGLVDGAFRALLEGRVGNTRYQLSDPGTLLDAATFADTTVSFSGSASYALALGPVSLTPELGLAGSTSTANSTDFGDIGTMSLGGTDLSGHIGVTLAADMALGDATLTPFAGVSLHERLLPAGATFTDGAGNTMPLAVDDTGSYVALALGANLVAAGTLEAGLRGDLKLGPNITDSAVSGHLKAKF